MLYWFLRRGMHREPFLVPPPRNSSNETRIELDILIQRQADATHEEIEFSRNMDVIERMYEWYDRETFALTGHGYGYSWFGRMAEKCNGLVNFLKLEFRRPRPYMVAPLVGKELSSLIGDIDTAAYPSGHSCDAWLLSGLLSGMHPEHSVKFKEMALRICDTRMILGVHYPSDIVAGEQTAKVCLDLMQSMET